MTMLVIFAGLIGVAIKVAEDLFPRRVWGGPLGSALSLALGAVESFCLTPIMIAFHRFIILDEVAPGYVVDPGRPGFMEFFGWLVALSILRGLVVLTQETLTAFGVPVLIAAIPTLVVLITVIVLSVRLIILFPAVAVNARGANAPNALADSEGHVFRIFMIFCAGSIAVRSARGRHHSFSRSKCSHSRHASGGGSPGCERRHSDCNPDFVCGDNLAAVPDACFAYCRAGQRPSPRACGGSNTKRAQR